MSLTLDVPAGAAPETDSRDRLAFRVWRFCAVSGPFYATAGLVFWALVAGFLPAPDESWNAHEVKEFFLQDDLRIRVGMVGYLFVAPFYTLWSIVITRVMRRIEGRHGLLHHVEFFGGIATTFVTFFSGVFWLAAAFRVEERSAQDVQLLNDVGWFIFDMTFMATLLQMCAVGVVILMDRRPTPYLPAWLGWLSFLAAFTFLPLVLLPFLQSGPFAWHGLFNYYVALGAFFVWLYVVSFFLFKAIARIEREELPDAGRAT